jgi:hypothetical protein
VKVPRESELGNEQKQTPIMSDDEERFMALEGLVQWTATVITQAQRIAATIEMLRSSTTRDANLRRRYVHSLHSECHFFAIAAHKVLEHRDWVLRFGLCANVNFDEFNQFTVSDVRDLRNMREHQVEYFQGKGRDRERWRVDTPEFSADASSMNGTMIGGRLDWKKFSEAAERLLPALLAEPIPYPKRNGIRTAPAVAGADLLEPRLENRADK